MYDKKFEEDNDSYGGESPEGDMSDDLDDVNGEEDDQDYSSMNQLNQYNSTGQYPGFLNSFFGNNYPKPPPDEVDKLKPFILNFDSM